MYSVSGSVPAYSVSGSVPGYSVSGGVAAYSVSGGVPAVLEVTGRGTPSLLVSRRKSSMEGLSSGRLSCCSLTSCRNEHTSHLVLSEQNL